MPLPLAHPAAVLALRRFCPRYFAFPALVIGSLAPDFAYVVNVLNNFSQTVVFLFGAGARNFTCVQQAWEWDDLSHTFAGSIVFCLPAGALALWVLHALRSALVATLPDPHRSVLQPLCVGPGNSAIVNLISLLIGAWTHLGWDSFTNGGHWLGRHWSLLHWQVGAIASTRIETYRVIWLLSSPGGPLAILGAYRRFLRGKNLPCCDFNQTETPFYVLWSVVTAASIFLAIPLALHFVPFGTSGSTLFNFLHRFTGYCIAAFGCGVIVVGLLAKLRQSRLNKIA